MNVRTVFAAALAAGLGAFASGARADREFGDNTRHYEDDAWYDVSEWFDGNDYNPTDEAWWRWDDETYQAGKDTGGDRDNDGWYGYNAGTDNDWYYDYYDPDPYGYYDYGGRGLYDFGSRYYDYDNDGAYDAYASYYDRDGDGLYDDYNYYSFSDRGSDKQKTAARDQLPRESRQQAVTGTVQKKKTVKVRGGKRHLVVAIQTDPAAKDQVVAADLGQAENLKGVSPKEGDKITVKGPKARVGKKDVVLATSVELNGTTARVDRGTRTVTGKVLSTHKTKKKIRGHEHLMAMVETQQKGKSHKIAVDLGPAARLKADVKNGDYLTFTGFPVSVKDKPLIMAQSIRWDEKTVSIDRRTDKAPGK